VVGGGLRLLGAVAVWVIWALVRREIRGSAIPPESWLAAAFLVLASNALAYFAWFRAIAIFPAMVLGIGTLAVPIIGVLSSAVLVGEAIGWREIVALSLVCSALLLILLGPVAARRGVRAAE